MLMRFYREVLYVGFLFLMTFLVTFLLFLDFFIIRIQYVIHVTYKICVYQLFMLPVRLLVYSRLLVAKFGGSQKLYTGFRLHRGRGWQPLGPVSFKGQL